MCVDDLQVYDTKNKELLSLDVRHFEDFRRYGVFREFQHIRVILSVVSKIDNILFLIQMDLDI